MRPSQDTYENLVASVVDVSSILIAYSIGVSQFNVYWGLAYALFDSWIVVWMRKPITRTVKKVISLF